MNKTRVKKKGHKKRNWKRRKGNKTLRKKGKGTEKNFEKKAIKKESEIKVLTHELLVFILSYLMLAHL
jgi:hypothetical protein